MIAITQADAEELIQICEDAAKWLGKAIAERIHEPTVCPKHLPNTLERLNKAIDKAQGKA